MSVKWIRTAAICAVILCVSACTSTVTPQPVEANQASYDEGSQNSGVVSTVTDVNGVATGWVITRRARDRYNAFIAKYGASMWSPAVGSDYGVMPYSDGLYFMTNEAMAKFVAMAEKARMAGGD